MKVDIEGMHCDACVRRLRKELEKVVEPIEGASVGGVEIGSISVHGPVDQDTINQAIRAAGYVPVRATGIRDTGS